MKPFLGINLTDNKKNSEPNGEEFLVIRTSSGMSRILEESGETVSNVVERSKLPLPFRFLQGACGVTGAIAVASLFKALARSDDLTIDAAYQNAPWVFWLAGGCVVVWLVLKLISNKKASTVLQKDESTQAFSKLDSVLNTVYSELSVPETAKFVDVLSFFYKVKDGNIKVCEKSLAQYFNPEYKIFADSENLYLANPEGKYAFPKSDIQRILTVKKHIRIASWNKEERFNKGEYKQYKLTSDNYGNIHCKSYCILEISRNNEIWNVYFPCYELPVLEELTGLKAQ